jgi:hypothetical protein
MPTTTMFARRRGLLSAIGAAALALLLLLPAAPGAQRYGTTDRPTDRPNHYILSLFSILPIG